MKGYRPQPRLKDGGRRIPTGSSFMAELTKAVDREARRFRVSRSFVIAVAVADALGVEAQPTYDGQEDLTRRVRNRRIIHKALAEGRVLKFGT